MPNYDMSGPRGMGPRTGRGLGHCPMLKPEIKLGVKPSLVSPKLKETPGQIADIKPRVDVNIK